MLITLPLLLLAVAACDAPVARTPPLPPSSAMTCKPRVLSRLYFGQDTPDGRVTETAWKVFVEEIIDPRLAGGFTLLEGQGRWRAPDGRLVREGSRVLEVIGEGGATEHAAIVEIVRAYKTRFRQREVLVVQSATRACS